MIVLFDDKFISISESDKILELKFKKETENMTDEQFKECALKWAEAVKDKKTKRLLVDIREFNYELSPEIVAWRNKNVVAVYNEVAAEKFAFISDKETVKQDDPANTFVTKYFSSIEEAKNWLQS